MSEQRRKISFLVISITVFTCQVFSENKNSKSIRKNVTAQKALSQERAIVDADAENPVKPSVKTPPESDGRPKKFKGKYSDDLLVSTEGKNEKNERELKVLVEGLNKLIKIEKPSAKRNELFLSKGAAYLNLARHYRIKAKTPGQFRQLEEINLKNALELAKTVEKSQFADIKQKARSLHLKGMSLVFLRDDEGSIAAFNQALVVDKNSPVNPRLSIYIAEYLYDKEKYNEALPRYSEYFTKLTPEEKALAIYKSAWCFILTKQYDNAEKTLLKIIGKKWAGDFAVDAVRDIAYSAVSHMKEQEVIEFGKKNFGEKNKAIMVDFYTEAYQVMIRESSNIDRPLLYNEILAVDSRTERKVVISLKRLNTHQRDFAAEMPYQEMLQIRDLIKESGFKSDSENFKYFASELETELKRLIKSYADTVSKKVKTGEKISDEEVSKRLSVVLMLHIEWFPNSSDTPQSYVLALDNCTFNKDSVCTLRLSREILKINSLKSIWGRAQLQLVGSLEILSQKDAKYKDEYFEELSALVKSQENTPQWITLVKKLTVFYVEAKKFEEAFPFLEKIHKKELNAENLYRKLYCAYELKNYKEVTAHSKLLPQKGAPFHNELSVLFREANIMMAQDSAKGEDFDKYEAHLSEFLKLAPDDAKSDIARVDYFQRLLDKEMYDKVLKGMDELSPVKKYNDPYKKTTQSLLLGMFKNGRAREVHKFLAKDSKLGVYPDFNHYWFRAAWIMKPYLPKKENEVLYQSNPKDRASIIGMLTLTKPETVIQYFTDFPPRDEKEKRIMLLSLQIQQGSKEAILPAKYLAVVQSVLPVELMNTQITPSEKLVGYVEFPEPSWPDKRLEKVMPDAVSRIRTIRSQVLRDVVGRSYAVQRRILTTALTSETRMVDFFKAAPIPKGLTPENEKSYRDEIAGISTEFAEQGGEYSKMIENIDAKVADLKKGELGVPAKLNDWPRPGGDVTKLVEAELAQKNGFGALVILESQRAYEKLSDEDYYSLRAYVVLKTIPNSVTAKYIQDELVTAKQEKLIEKWKELLESSGSAKREVATDKQSGDAKKDSGKDKSAKKKDE
jgi:tetratricopeptide (TPR) repeat protein